MFVLLKQFYNSFFCKHDLIFDENIYGDQINNVGGHRSWWRCKKCGNYVTKPELHYED